MVFSTAVYKFIMLGDRGVCAGSPALFPVPSTLRPCLNPRIIKGLNLFAFRRVRSAGASGDFLIKTKIKVTWRTWMKYLRSIPYLLFFKLLIYTWLSYCLPTELDNINFFEGKKVEDVGGWPEAKLTGLPLPVDARVLTNTIVKGRPQTSYSVRKGRASPCVSSTLFMEN